MVQQTPYCNGSFFENSLNLQNTELYKMLVCSMGEGPSSGGTRGETLPWLRHHATMALLF